jgi:hypothetical protein
MGKILLSEEAFDELIQLVVPDPGIGYLVWFDEWSYVDGLGEIAEAQVVRTAHPQSKFSPAGVPPEWPADSEEDEHCIECGV